MLFPGCKAGYTHNAFNPVNELFFWPHEKGFIDFERMETSNTHHQCFHSQILFFSALLAWSNTWLFSEFHEQLHAPERIRGLTDSTNARLAFITLKIFGSQFLSAHAPNEKTMRNTSLLYQLKISGSKLIAIILNIRVCVLTCSEFIALAALHPSSTAKCGIEWVSYTILESFVWRQEWTLVRWKSSHFLSKQYYIRCTSVANIVETLLM